ncbi:MAG: extracellular solute-binding protein [Phycisphaerae bacterium]|nr:extracellular solute-binding protein [Phycisphaerae bacterium]
MKQVLISVILLLGTATAVTIALIPAASTDNRVPLVWATDPNPQRDPQVAWFNKLYPDCHLRIDPDNAGVMKVVVQSSSGMGPDLIGHVTDNSIDTYVTAGILWDLTDYAEKMGFGVETLPEGVRPLVQYWNPQTFERRQYTYPANMTDKIIFYNKDIFDQQGVPYPPKDLTWTRYIELGRRLTRYASDQARVPEIFGSAGADFHVILWGLGGAQFNEAGTRCLLGEPPAVEAARFLHDLYFKHKVEPSPVQQASVAGQGGWGSSAFFSWFADGRLAMFFAERWMLIQIRRYFSELKTARAEWEAAHPGEPYTGPQPPRMGAVFIPRFENGTRYSPLRARGIGINALSPHREDALKFLQYLAGPKYSELINLGADAMPGNEEYISPEQFYHPDWPGEKEIHDVSIESLRFGRVLRRSPFITPSRVARLIRQVTDQIESTPDMTPDALERLMRQCAARINREMAQNIGRETQLAAFYDHLLKGGAEPLAETGPP